MAKFLDEEGLQQYTNLVQTMADGETIEYAMDLERGVKVLRLKDGGISKEHLSSYLQFMLGIGDVASMTANEIAQALAQLDLDTQTYIVGEIDASKVSGWSLSETENVITSMDSSLRSNFVSSKVGIEQFGWNEVDSFISFCKNNGLQSSIVGKSKNVPISGRGTFPATIIGVDHDNLTGGGKAKATFMFLDEVDTLESKPSNDKIYPFNISTIRTEYENILAAFPAELSALVKSVDKKYVSNFNDPLYGSVTFTMSTGSFKIYPIGLKEYFEPSYGGYDFDTLDDGPKYQYFSQGGKINMGIEYSGKYYCTRELCGFDSSSQKLGTSYIALQDRNGSPYIYMTQNIVGMQMFPIFSI